MISTEGRQKFQLGQLLLDQGAISAQQLQEALDFQRRSGATMLLGEVLQKMGARAGYAPVSDFTSSDGGIVRVVLQKTDAMPPVSGEIPGNYERVASILRRHTTVSHLFSRYPYVRPLQKLRARIDEQRIARLHRPPREVLDGLIKTIL